MVMKEKSKDNISVRLFFTVVSCGFASSGELQFKMVVVSYSLKMVAVSYSLKMVVVSYSFMFVTVSYSSFVTVSYCNFVTVSYRKL